MPPPHGCTRLAPLVPADGRIVAMALGALGVNRAETGVALEAALAARGYTATVANNAALVIPAAGVEHGIGINAGTGAIGVGVDGSGAPLSAGGWGSVIGDEGGAAALVREAARGASGGR